MRNIVFGAACFALLAACETTGERPGDPEMEKDAVIIPLTSEITVERVETYAGRCAKAAFLRTDAAAGVRACDAALRDDLSARDRANTHYNRGYLHFQLGDWKEAEADFTKAIELDMPQLHKAYYARGLCKQNTQRLRPASEDFAKAYELKPDWRWAQEKKKQFWWAYGDPNPYK